MLFKNLIVIITLFFFSCSNTEKKDTHNIQKKTIENNSKKTSPNVDTLLRDNPRIKIVEFAIDSIKFRYRIITTDTTNICFIDKSINNTWQNSFHFNYSYRTYNLLIDVNNDNKIDIVNDWKWKQEVYQFNSRIKDFTKVPVYLTKIWSLLDTAENVYCDLDEIQGIDLSSKLYKFNNYKIEILKSARFITKKIEGQDFPDIIAIEIYDGDFLSKQKSKLIKRNSVKLESWGFDYFKFWRNIYQKK